MEILLIFMNLYMTLDCVAVFSMCVIFLFLFCSPGFRFDCCLGQRGWFSVRVCVTADQSGLVSAHINKKTIESIHRWFFRVSVETY